MLLHFILASLFTQHCQPVHLMERAIGGAALRDQPQQVIQAEQARRSVRTSRTNLGSSHPRPEVLALAATCPPTRISAKTVDGRRKSALMEVLSKIKATAFSM